MLPTPGTESGRPLRKDAARNRELLIASARQVFAARGFEASMDDIAHQAGLGVGTAYRHFANKYELANAIFDDAVVAVVDSALDNSSGNDAWTGLVSVVEQILTAQTGNRAIREIVLAVRQDDWQHHDMMIAPLRTVFDRARAAGALRPDVEYTDLIVVLMMLCTISEQVAEQTPLLWRRYLTALLDVLRPDGATMPEPAITESQLHAAFAKNMPPAFSQV